MGLSVQRPKGAGKTLFTPVCTLLYQSPEQLFSSANGYNEKADIWSLGCIFYELLTGKVLFHSSKSKDQLVEFLLQGYGAEEFEKWQAGTKTDIFKKHSHRLRKIKSIFNWVRSCVKDPQALDLLEKLLCLDPEVRLSAEEVLNHPFLNTCLEKK